MCVVVCARVLYVRIVCVVCVYHMHIVFVCARIFVVCVCVHV